MTDEIPFGPTGRVVYERTYSRTKPNGEKETWPETVRRVARGNMELVYGPWVDWDKPTQTEYDRLVHYMERFAIIPAGRHLWASGVKGRQYLFNCHVAGWGEKLSDHFEFTFMRLMEGGGVGANYSSRYLAPFGAPRRGLRVHVVCDPAHADYDEMQKAGVLSTEYDSDWDGAFEVEDSREGWAAALVDLIDTYMTDDEVKHANRVYDVSRVRPKGARLKTFGGTASGPHPFAVMLNEVARVMNGAAYNAVPQRWVESDGKAHVAILTESADGKSRAYFPNVRVDETDGKVMVMTALPAPQPVVEHLTPVQAMEIDHAIAECVVSGGVRRSARMAICRWDDPFIMDFISCKADSGKHWTTNISVEVDDDFLTLLRNYPSHEGVEKRLEGMGNQARMVHEAVVNGMLTNGEPGYWNSSLSNVGEVGTVEATNPCGEIALEAWENCNLGHVNLDAFAPTTKHGTPDFAGMYEAHRLMTRFLVRATYGDVNDPKQADRLASNRRIGVGHLGVQGFYAKQGLPYSQVPGNRYAESRLVGMRMCVRDAARDYAFELRIPEPVKVTTVAPTGSIAKLPGVTEGIHPIYGRYFNRRVRFNVIDTEQNEAVTLAWQQGFEVERDIYDQSGNTMVVTYPTMDKLVAEVEALGYPTEFVQSADELTVDQMLAFQEMYQRCYADNAVSFTVNVPEGLDPEELSKTLSKWLPGLKGTTVMVDGTRPQAPYERITREQYEAAQAKRIEDGTDEDCATGACPVR